MLRFAWYFNVSILACRHSKDLSLKCLRSHAKNMRMIIPRKVFFLANELTNKGHACMRESWETFHWSLTNLELLFVISVHFTPGFLKTGLAKISTHSITWDRALFSFHFENYISAGKEKRKESLIQNVYETSSAHFFDWLTFAKRSRECKSFRSIRSRINMSKIQDC